jgi:hypothetical protein
MERRPIIPLDAPTPDILQKTTDGSSDLADPIVGIMAPDEDFDEAFRAVLSAIAELIPAEWDDKEANSPHPQSLPPHRA